MKNSFIKIFVLAILFTFGVSYASAQISEKSAQDAIARKDLKKAKDIYSKLAADTPENTSYLNWVARLSAWMGNYKDALRIYDEVLQKNQNNNEALIGKAYVLMWQKNYRKAKTILATAEKNGNYDTAFLVAKINYFRYQNKLSEARELIKVANEAGSANAEIKTIEETINTTKTKIYQVGCEQNFEPFTATTSSCFANLNIQVDENKFSIRAQSGKRFNKFYRDIGATWQRDLTGKLSFTVNAAIEAKRSLNLDTNFGLNYKINDRLSVGADYRFWRLNKNNIKIFSTNLLYSLTNKTQIQTTLYNSKENVLLIRLNRQITRPLNTSFTYLKTFETTKSDRINFSQNAFVLNNKFQLTKNISVSGSIGLTKQGTESYREIYGFGFSITR